MPNLKNDTSKTTVQCTIILWCLFYTIFYTFKSVLLRGIGGMGANPPDQWNLCFPRGFWADTKPSPFINKFLSTPLIELYFFPLNFDIQIKRYYVSKVIFLFPTVIYQFISIIYNWLNIIKMIAKTQLLKSFSRSIEKFLLNSNSFEAWGPSIWTK